MIFNSKQLEELENIHDSTGAFEEEGDDESGFDEVGEAAMDWRRGLIEEAAENIKRAKTRPVEPHLTYPINSMLFDRDARRFARVQRSVPGYLKIVYLSGGDREFGALDVMEYLREYGAQKRLSELSEQLGMNDSDVALALDRLGITPIEEPEEEVAEPEVAPLPPAPIPPVFAKGRRAPIAEEAEEEEEEEEEEEVAADEEEIPGADDVDIGFDDDEPELPADKGKKGAAPPAKTAKAAGPKAAPEKHAAPAQKAKATPAPHKAKEAPPKDVKKAVAKGANPIDDPNGYIKGHYQEMSNRELARVTGLSEHTIRRKLGEWGLKRKKEL